jgi:hypothetical protein
VQLHFYLSTVYCGRWRILSHHALNADSPNVFCSRAGCGSVVPVFGSYYIYTHIKHVHIHTYLHSLAALACTTLSAFMLNACLHMLYFIPFRLPTLQFHSIQTAHTSIPSTPHLREQDSRIYNNRRYYNIIITPSDLLQNPFSTNTFSGVFQKTARVAQPRLAGCCSLQ